MDTMSPDSLPCADEMRALRGTRRENAQRHASVDLSPYIQATARLVKKMAAAGERGIVVKFLVEDYPDEAACGQAIALFGQFLQSKGYSCCVSYDTYALGLSGKEVKISPMRNPAIIAMTVMW